jgi:predicted RNA-binding Zn-ribbon protein involved in translation (DUF1610 family)
VSSASGSSTRTPRSRAVSHTCAVPPALAQRLAMLAAVALLAAVAAMAIVAQNGSNAGAAALTSAPAPAGWNIAFAGSRGATGDAQRTTCGQVLAPQSLGVTHPVLPCGAKVILRSGNKQVLTRSSTTHSSSREDSSRSRMRSRRCSASTAPSSSSGASPPPAAAAARIVNARPCAWPRLLREPTDT